MAAIDTSSRLKDFEDCFASMLLALVWLVPNHQPPWTAFHHELGMAIALGAILMLLSWQGRQEFQLPVFGSALLLLALLPWLQWSFGLFPKAGTAFISSVYIAAFALAIAIGFSARDTAGERLMAILALALVLAALLNLPIQLIQWFQWYATDITSVRSMLITPIGSESRPSGSILQPNMLATLHVWALLGLTWWRIQRRLNGIVFVMVFALVVSGLVLTQSRAGMLEMALCTAVLLLFARRWAGSGVCTVWTAMLLLIFIWTLNFESIAKWLGVMGSAEGRLSAIDGGRTHAWLAFGMAVIESPWWGYGITDVGFPYLLQAESQPEIYAGQRFGHAHNLLLDIALWVGLPLAVLLGAMTSVWGWRQIRAAVRNPSLLIPVLMLMTLTIHSMLELPHQYLYLLVPAGLCIGFLCATSGASSVLRFGRSGAFVAAVGVWTAAAAIAWDYFPYQERYTEWRFDNLGVGYRLDRPIKPPLVLDQLHDELVLYRTDFTKPLSSEQLDWVEETARAVTTAPAMYYAAQALAMGGRTQDALRWMRRYNAVTPPELVEQTRRIWARDQRTHPAMRGIDWPPYAGRLSTFRFETEPTSGP